MKKTIKNLIKVYNYGNAYKTNLILQIIGSIIGFFISVIIPVLASKFIVNFTNSLWNQAIFMFIIIFILMIIRELKTVLIRKNTQVIHCGIYRNLRKKLSKEMLNIEQKSIDNTSSGLFINRLTTDTDNMANMFTTGCGNVFGVISNIGSFIAVLIIDYHMFLYYLFSSLILTILNLVKTTKYGIKNKEYKSQLDKVYGLTGELVRGSHDIKMLNCKNNIVEEIDKNIALETEKKFAMRNVEIDYNLLIGIIKNTLELISVILLIILIKNNKLSIAIGLALYNYKDSVLTDLMDKVSRLIDEAKEFNISCERVFEIINSKKYKKEKFGTKKIKNIDGNFEFKKVNFSYDKCNVLNNLSFKVKSGTTVSFVGKSGAGKTTIFNLLCKMYEVNSGEILIDGININGLDESSIRGNITVISQNPYIFNMSIKDNLRLVKENLTDEEIKEVCHLACLDGFIETLPNKYDTIVGEGGVNLSGGQRQRLAIARALVQKTKIILFDEATSALDNETQRSIQKAIDNLKGKYTIMIIAHRISTVVNSDNIMLLSDGKIIESGTHNELLKSNKIYKKLCETEVIN